MAKQNKIFVHLSTLLVQARLRHGFATLRELYRAKDPAIDYNTWLHAESGRRVPNTLAVQNIANILGINKRDVLIAYCKDKFDDTEYHEILDLFEHNRFANVDTLLEARHHERSGEYIFTEEQIKAFQKDTRLRLFLTYTYDRDLKTTFERLGSFFKMEMSQVKNIVDQLESLRLVEVIDETVKRNHAHTNFPNNVDASTLRRNLLLESLELGLNSDSHITNYFVNISPESYKKVLGFFDLIEANLTKMDKDERDKMNSRFFQITLTGIKISEGCNDDTNRSSVHRQSE